MSSFPTSREDFDAKLATVSCAERRVYDAILHYQPKDERDPGPTIFDIDAELKQNGHHVASGVIVLLVFALAEKGFLMGWSGKEVSPITQKRAHTWLAIVYDPSQFPPTKPVEPEPDLFGGSTAQGVSRRHVVI